MAIDSPRKHHRSNSDNDSPESSKRHKNHHYNHRSRTDDAINNKETIIATKKKPVQDDYDMEEGEIVEDEPLIADNIVISDVESGEIMADDLRGDFDDSYTSVDGGASRKSPGSDQSGESKDGGQSHHDQFPVRERIANGNLASRLSKGESRSHLRHESPRKESRKEKERHRSTSKRSVFDVMEVDDDDRVDRRNLYSCKVGEMCRDATYRSPSRGRNHLETKSDTTRSESPDERRERSQSILHDSHLNRRHRHYRDERLYGNGKVGWESWDKRGEYREPSKERSERYYDGDWEKGRHSYRSRDCEREKDFVRDRERPRETKSDRYRGGSRDRDLDEERDRRWEKDRGRNRNRASERERRDDRERDMSRELEIDTRRNRYIEARDEEDDKSRRCHKYDGRDDVYGNRDRNHSYDEAESGKGRNTKRDTEADEASKVGSVKESDHGMYRDDDDDQDDHQETIMLKPAELEDDVDKIKEESRKRREAILQKYKAKQCQQQQQAASLIPKVSDEQLAEKPSQNPASLNVIQDNNGIKDNGKSSMDNDLIVIERSNDVLGEGSPKSEKTNDMFCDDIFGDSPAGVRKMGKGDGLPVERSGLHDNWDDPEGYYSFRLDEILDGRYEIKAAHGKGVFSTVVRAKDLKAGSGDPEEVAIKIIRNNETMLKAGTEELVILKKLVGADPEDRRHCVRYLSNFKYRNHLCIVFECLHMNLREVLKKFGRNIGLKLTAVRTYAKQLFIALKHLRNCGVLHCDIKPDNMLVNDSKNVLKLCDFGNAMFAGKNEITPYLVSRFYRAPEIILGLPYDHPMDIWSVGCCLYELYTGKVLFPGATNNDMLRLHMELKGPFPKKMLRKGAFIEQHFDQDLNFLAVEEDPVTRRAIRRLMVNIKPKDIGNIVRGSAGEDPKILANFKDLLDKIFVLDPDKRLTVSQALNHPFITGK